MKRAERASSLAIQRSSLGLPIEPPLIEAELVRCKRPYQGPIRPGMIFAWEPDLPTARCLIIVTRIGGGPPDKVIEHGRGTAIIGGPRGDVVWHDRFPDREREVWNDFDRFREAVIPTLFQDQTP